MRRATPTGYPAGIVRFLLSQLNALAEDKRFELLRVSPTRFPILLTTVRRKPGPCVTRHDGTRRTIPTAAGRLRMRRRLRRTGRRSSPVANHGPRVGNLLLSGSHAPSCSCKAAGWSSAKMVFLGDGAGRRHRAPRHSCWLSGSRLLVALTGVAILTRRGAVGCSFLS